MLILTRRVGETLMIGDDVSVTVLGVKGNQVRIGVNAPKDVSVHREEIYMRIQSETDEELREELLRSFRGVLGPWTLFYFSPLTPHPLQSFHLLHPSPPHTPNLHSQPFHPSRPNEQKTLGLAVYRK